MSDSIRIADHLFDDAESLVQRIEHACRIETSEQPLYDQLTAELLPVSGAEAAILWARHQGETHVLSRSGIGVSLNTEFNHTTSLSPSHDGGLHDHGGTESGSYRPPLAKWADRSRLESQEQLGPQTEIGLTLQFAEPTDAALSRTLCELSETILGLASGVFLRHRFGELSSQSGAQSDRDRVIDGLNAGCGLSESLSCIAGTVAGETGVDRVAILRTTGSSAQLLVSSTQPRVDRRARQVRLLEALVSKVIQSSDRFRYVVGNPAESAAESADATVAAALDPYLNDSGCRELCIEAIVDQQTDPGRAEPLAAIVLERFRLDASRTDKGFDALRVPAFAAIRRAFERDQVSWTAVAYRLAAGGISRRLVILGCVFLLLGLALAFVPADFKIPVEGRLLTAKHHRIYAPANGTVSELSVRNGQPVEPGQPLLRIRSANLDQQQRQLEGALATAMSKLAVVAAARSQSREAPAGSRNALASSDEQVLKTEVKGLRTQLDLVKQQQRELSLFSPIAGQVDRWDLQQTLAGRPVVHGQYLIDIVSVVDGWIVELEIPDDEAQYIVDAQAGEPCEVTFRLRSGPEKLYRGTLQQVSGVTQFDSAGRPVVRATFAIEADDQDLRFGATVIAHVHCGSRPLGFIWFRHLIEWARRIDWI